MTHLPINVSHTAILEQIPSLILLMDKDSNFIYANQYTVTLFGYKELSQMIGLNAYGMRCPAVESAPDFIAQDRQVLQAQTALTILDFHIYADKSNKIFLTKKTPYYQNEILAGTICQCTEIYSQALQNLCNTLVTQDQRYKKTKQLGGSYTPGIASLDNILTPREKDCLFYLLRGQTMKQVAAYLKISARTVEYYLENMKTKLACNKKSELIEYGISAGYLSYIPDELIKRNASIIML